MDNFYYTTNCISSTAAKIDAMVDRAREITLATLARSPPRLCASALNLTPVPAVRP